MAVRISRKAYAFPLPLLIPHFELLHDAMHHLIRILVNRLPLFNVRVERHFPFANVVNAAFPGLVAAPLDRVADFVENDLVEVFVLGDFEVSEHFLHLRLGLAPENSVLAQEGQLLALDLADVVFWG